MKKLLIGTTLSIALISQSAFAGSGGNSNGKLWGMLFAGAVTTAIVVSALDHGDLRASVKHTQPAPPPRWKHHHKHFKQKSYERHYNKHHHSQGYNRHYNRQYQQRERYDRHYR